MKTYLVNDIGNYYGGLTLKEENNKFYWRIDGEGSGGEWFEIPENVFKAILPLTKEDN